ncbi:MAG: deoxyribodipyrimidine photo-lyase, partial [Bacteroidota bacterium]|nr:deoxyribodipyrimidine photo-lyase [Bacteroidota bacterium]
MSKSEISALVWYRNDLRTLDHLGLRKAVESGYRVLAFYTFNPKHYHTHRWGFKKTDRFRAQFLIESVQALKQALKSLNISLIIDTKTPDKALPEWIKKYKVKEIYLQHEWTEEEKKEEKAVLAQIDSNIIWNRHYEQFLFHPSDLPFSRPQVPEVFSTFRKVCEKEVQLRPSFPNPTSLGTSNLIEINDKVPTLADLGL